MIDNTDHRVIERKAMEKAKKKELGRKRIPSAFDRLLGWSPFDGDPASERYDPPPVVVDIEDEDEEFYDQREVRLIRRREKDSRFDEAVRRARR